MVKLFASDPSGAMAMWAIDVKACNVLICDVIITTSGQVGHGRADDVLKQNVKHVKISPPGNPDQLNLSRQHFVETIHNIKLHVFGDNASERKHRMGESHRLFMCKNGQAHDTRSKGGKPKGFESKYI